MADKSIVSNSKLTALADAIRTKGGTSGQLTVDEMAQAVADIPTGGQVEGGYVVHGASRHTYTYNPDPPYIGVTSVTVEATEGRKVIKENGTYDVLNDAEAVVNVPSSGVDITDGIVVKARDTNGYPTEVDVYGDVPPYAFGYYNAGGAMGQQLTNVTFKTALSDIGAGAFQKTAIADMEIPDSVDSIGLQVFRGNTVLDSYIHENARNLYGYNGAAMRALEQCNSAISKIQLGAVGKPVTGLYTFLTKKEYDALTLTIYCAGNNVDSFLNRARQFITGGTIVFKASEDTTYNGTSYAAGDTILTNEVA